MATTQADTRAPAFTPRNTRRNEIVAIALLAVGLLLALCLVFFNPDDTSLNAAGQAETRNLVGPVGAYVADALLQSVGLAAYLLPLLLLLAAWRRFRTLRLRAPLPRLLGLFVLLASAAGLLALGGLPLLFDGRVRAGGLVGTLMAEQLAGALGGAGAFVLLAAIAAVGLLLATNFSFARAYERLVAYFGHPSTILPAVAARFNAWRAERRERARQRAEERRAARAEHERRKAEASSQKRELTAQERVEAFMRETDPAAAGGAGAREQIVSAGAAIKRSAAPEENHAGRASARGRVEDVVEQFAPASGRRQPGGETAAEEQQPPPNGERVTRGRAVEGDVVAETSGVEPGGEQAVLSPSVEEEADFDEEVADMIASASVVRTDFAEEEERERREGARARAAARRAEQQAAMLSGYRLPGLEFLNAPQPRHEQADEELRQLATRVAEKCREFNVTGKIEYICPGPVVTTYEFKPDPGVKYSRVTGLVDDLCLALKAESIRIDRVPGKAHVGIEVPNAARDNIMLREVIESRHFQESASKLTLALGKTIDGMNYVADLARMPHLLIAGATGTGKSVCLNSLVVSVLYKARPDEVKFIMIDPKRLELGLYADIPHLATPIITEPKRAANALKWAVREMENRYKELAKWGVRNIDGFNTEIARRNLVEDFDEEGNPWKPLPYLVVIVDELADLMMTAGHEVEEAITRLAQMARAVGIHLVLATQRPSVDVITGLIKANFPSRIAFRVSSKVDSRTIIDANGAEQLLGRGDMLFLPPGTSRLVRVHGAYVDEAEIGRIVAHIKGQGAPVYDETITQSEEEAAGGDGFSGERDEMFEQALRICVEMKRASTSVLQRRLRIGYGRAAAILDAMEREGYIGQADGARPRPVLGKGFEAVSHWDELERGDD